MSRAKTRLFMAALDELVESAAELREKLLQSANKDDYPTSDEITRLDDAMEAVLSTRNEYCADNDVVIEDGYVEWTESHAQIEAAKEDS
jgi:hypothetical protein